MLPGLLLLFLILVFHRGISISNCGALAFSTLRRPRRSSFPTALRYRTTTSLPRGSDLLIHIRGGQQQQQQQKESQKSPEDKNNKDQETGASSAKRDESVEKTTTADKSGAPPPSAAETAPTMPTTSVKQGSLIMSLGSLYGKSLEQRPVVTKSVTACCIFALSDWLAQQLEQRAARNQTNDDEKKNTATKYNSARTVSSALVGLLYFGPAAHYWYEMIFRLLPGTTLFSTLQKATLGQLIFGPSFTCIFFATSLMQAGTFSLGTWIRKIRDDLPGAWLAGVGFWPLVDLVSYSVVPKQWIPLFVNICSLIWTVYLSIVSNR